MPRTGFLANAVPRLKQYMTEQGRPLTSRNVADLLGVTTSSAYSVLFYMESVGIIQSLKSGRKKLYFLKGTYDENQIAKFSSIEAPRSPRRRKRSTLNEKTTDVKSHIDPMIHPNPNVPQDMLPALAIIGMYRTDKKKPETVPPKQVSDEKRRVSTPLLITVKRHGQIKSLPKEARLLSMSDTNRLREHYLKGLDGYEDIAQFDCFFAEASALENGEYGKTFYASKGTNSWEKVYKITVERRIEH